MLASLFNILFISIPLVFYKNTSELFEFNKIVLLYLFTVLITAGWIYKSVKAKKFNFNRSLLDIPILLYLCIYLISTLLSIDPRTSWLGYYSRFNGGFMSQICFALLYWAFVNNINREAAIKIVKSLLISMSIVAIIGFFEHFGIFATCPVITYQRLNMPQNEAIAAEYSQYSGVAKVNFLFTTKCWEQDLQNRVFSTLGQPNWLAAVLVALIPLTWYFMLQKLKSQNSKLETNSNFKITNLKSLFWYSISVLFFTILLFTKSRSGLLAFGVESIIFWALIYWKYRKKYLKHFLLLIITFVIIFLFSGFNKTLNSTSLVVTSPALEQGGTESGSIRRIVWKGAWQIFKHYPIFGTGPETFAYAYPMFKPVEHNLISEWDFIYNKAHNEYLNYLANTGILGFLSYVSLIVFSIIQIFKNTKHESSNPKQTKNLKLESSNFEFDSYFVFQISILAGYVSILVTNFFGFSVVLTSLLLFLLPALSVALMSEDIEPDKKYNLIINGYLILSLLAAVSIYVTYNVVRYWRADIHYNNAKLASTQADYDTAHKEIAKAIKLSPNESAFVADLAIIQAHTADNREQAEEVFNSLATASTLAPYNINYKRTHAVLLTQLSQYNKEYVAKALEIIKDATIIAPNDAKLFYQLGLIYLKTGQTQPAIEALSKSVELKTNYKEARFALGITYSELNQTQNAAEQFEYILYFIDPKDELTKKYLDEIVPK
jgi:putative inorganic carbon (HCO3(-)) transporter